MDAVGVDSAVPETAASPANEGTDTTAELAEDAELPGADDAFAAAPPEPAVEPAAVLTAEDRRTVQRHLARLGYYDGAIDGLFGRSTAAAIVRFRTALGTAQTGDLTQTEIDQMAALAAALPDPAPVEEPAEEPPTESSVATPIPDQPSVPESPVDDAAGSSPFSNDLLNRFGDRTSTGSTDPSRLQEWVNTLTRAIRPCWTSHATGLTGTTPAVEMVLQLQSDGTVVAAAAADTIRLRVDPDYRTAAEAIASAVTDPRCQPIPLPSEDYPGWETLRLQISAW